jgi:hypothetical protein
MTVNSDRLFEFKKRYETHRISTLMTSRNKKEYQSVYKSTYDFYVLLLSRPRIPDAPLFRLGRLVYILLGHDGKNQKIYRFGRVVKEYSMRKKKVGETYVCVKKRKNRISLMM